jgi:hypothetical protein
MTDSSFQLATSSSFNLRRLLLAALGRSLHRLNPTYSVEKLTPSLPADFRRLTNDTDNWLDGGN